MAKHKSIILLVADPELRENLKKNILLPAGYAVLALENTEAAQELINQEDSFLLIIGNDFNERSALDIADSFLKENPHTGIVLLTEKLEQEEILIALQSGISDVVQAPFEESKILEAVARAAQYRMRMRGWVKKETGRLMGKKTKRLSELEAILKQVNDGVLVLDENGKVVMINKTMLQSFGLADIDWAGYSLSEVIKNKELLAMLSRKDDDIGRGEIEAPDGKSYSVQISKVGGVGTVASFQDISYLKELDRLKGDFVNTVSHDLRSPLTAILGYVALIERAGEVNEQQAVFIQRVKDSVDSTTKLINDLLILGRIEVGSEKDIESIAFSELVEERMEAYKLRADEKNISFLLQAEKNLPEVVGNRTQLRQVADHLIGNEIKYTPESGEIRLMLREQANQLVLYVGDNGPGIHADDQKLIFEKFYRAKDVAWDVEGTGLGLAIVKSIVDNHRGRIWVDSAPGEGSIFTVVLPIADQK